MKKTILMLGLIAASALSVLAAPKPLRAADGGGCICNGYGCDGNRYYAYCLGTEPQQCSMFCTPPDT